jgi:NAD(P)-dependent dehydrogenase (short-subunit alcohol dehydrogenase family)
MGLASRGAQVLLADVNAAGGAAAVERIRSAVPGASVGFERIDLAELADVRRFAAGPALSPPLDILVNNAGILPPLRRRTTRDGFELKFGINVLGHFALTGLLLERLLAGPAPRVAWVSSLVHRYGQIDFDDLQAEHSYTSTRAYNQAKLACLVLAMELQARAQAAGLPLLGVAAHPGISRTAIGGIRSTEHRQSLRDHLEGWSFWIAMHLFSQAPNAGAWPILQAAAAEGVQGGDFWGPDGFGEFSGQPKRVKPSKPALDAATRQRLWAECERLTGVKYL